MARSFLNRITSSLPDSSDDDAGDQIETPYVDSGAVAVESQNDFDCVNTFETHRVGDAATKRGNRDGKSGRRCYLHSLEHEKVAQHLISIRAS